MGIKIDAYPCPPHFVYEFTCESDAVNYCRSEASAIAQTLKTWNCIAAIIRYPNGDPLRIPADVIEEMGTMHDYEPRNIVWIAQCGIDCRELLEWAIDLQQNPRKVGITRISDGTQLIMSDGCQALNPNHHVSKTVTWKRSDFWHPGDYQDFQATARQQSNFQFTWRSFDPVTGPRDRDRWLEFTTQYDLLEAGSDFYHVCSNLGMREMSRSEVLR